MPYFYNRKKVPFWVTVALSSLSFLMLAAQVVGPIMAFVYLQLVNNYYFKAFADPNFNPMTFDFDGATKQEAGEKFWLNFLVGMQIIDGVVLMISIVQIRCIIRKVGVNNKMVD